MDGTTRRQALGQLGGGLGLAALAGFGLTRRVAAQEPTPTPAGPPEGRYAVLRVRKLKADRSAEDLTTMVREEFLPILRDIPGFVDYFVISNAETGDWAAVGVFEDAEGAAASNAAAAEWGALGASDYVEGDPIVIEGEIVVAAAETT